MWANKEIGLILKRNIKLQNLYFFMNSFFLVGTTWIK